MKRYLCLIALTIIALIPLTVTAEPLTVSYFERPPYYFTNNSGDAEGFLVARTKKILQTAKLEAQFLSLSPQQIIYILQHANTPHCSIGWFKKPERELFTKFTKPIYQNKSLVLLTTRSKQKYFSTFKTLEEIFSSQELIIARVGSFSYGSYVDHLLEQLTPKSKYFSKNQADLLQAIYANQASYMLVAPEEIEQMIVTAALPAAEFITITLDKVPSGNYRYLMCGQAVSNELIDQLNSAIEELYPDLD